MPGLARCSVRDAFLKVDEDTAAQAAVRIPAAVPIVGVEPPWPRAVVAVHQVNRTSMVVPVASAVIVVVIFPAVSSTAIAAIVVAAIMLAMVTAAIVIVPMAVPVPGVRRKGHARQRQPNAADNEFADDSLQLACSPPDQRPVALHCMPTVYAYQGYVKGR